MQRSEIDPKEFLACIGAAVDYVAVKLVELGIPATPARITKLRAEIEDFTMTAVESAILPHTPAKWSWQMAARLISMEVAKQIVADMKAMNGRKGS